MSKEDFYKYGESLGVSINDLQRLKMLANKFQEDMADKEQDWNNFECELMDWAHELGREQKYTPYPAQFLEWLKNNYKLPIKKL